MYAHNVFQLGLEPRDLSLFNFLVEKFVFETYFYPHLLCCASHGDKETQKMKCTLLVGCTYDRSILLIHQAEKDAKRKARAKELKKLRKEKEKKAQVHLQFLDSYQIR